jgi:hypothetical protein
VSNNYLQQSFDQVGCDQTEISWRQLVEEKTDNKRRFTQVISRGHSRDDLLKTAAYLWRESRDTELPLTMGGAIEVTIKMAEIMESGEWGK